MTAAMDGSQSMNQPQIPPEDLSPVWQWVIQGDYPRAIAELEQRLEQQPGVRTHYWWLGVALLLQGQELEAQATWLAAITDGNPEEIDTGALELGAVLLSVAQQQQQSEQWGTATLLYQQLLEFDPSHAAAYHGLGVCQLQQGEVTAAIATLSQALELQPHGAAVRLDLGIALSTHGDRGAAIQQFQAALELEPDNVEVLRHLGMNWEDEGNPEAAIACYQQALTLQPHFPAAHNNWGNLLLAQGVSGGRRPPLPPGDRPESQLLSSSL
ncbi:hypothetical protein DO97_13080 [Neosynechococcus sphagnicola sy1]|uniref:Uncharacterized protein n=1 Tax=Neosynechococcus sphagnicola sy1 TaxID=1497020 RepID=A0A098TSH9_9CYAN|nr:tetratricopeptide repeat protein [Neosynechococcus sphagnicola]KGF73733.1 hypothetical protein DO97_13080 [Neosynechococcus sphagnicola sy1]